MRSKNTHGLDIALNGSTNLVASARFIRLKSGAPRWWEHQLQTQQASSERRRLLLILLLYGTPKTLFKLVAQLDHILDELSDADWKILYRDYRMMSFGTRLIEAHIASNEIESIKKLGSRLNAYIGLRLVLQQRFELATAMAEGNLEPESPEGQFVLQSLLIASRDSDRSMRSLKLIQRMYLLGVPSPTYAERDSSISASIAEQISAEPDKFPLSLVAAADSQLRSTAGARARKLSEIAERERWF